MKRLVAVLSTIFRPNMLDEYMKFIVERPLIWLVRRPHRYDAERDSYAIGPRIAHFTAFHFANWLSYSRLVSGGISIWVGCELPSRSHHALWVTLTLVSIALFAFSDSLDGISARIVEPYRPNPSDWGKTLDPTMDKLATFMFFAGWLIAAGHIGGVLNYVTLVLVGVRVILEGMIVVWAGKEHSLNPQAKAGIVGKVKLGIDCLFIIGLTKFGLIFHGEPIGTGLYDASLVVLAFTFVLCALVIRHHRGNYLRLKEDAERAELVRADRPTVNLSTVRYADVRPDKH